MTTWVNLTLTHSCNPIEKKWPKYVYGFLRSVSIWRTATLDCWTTQSRRSTMAHYGSANSEQSDRFVECLWHGKYPFPIIFWSLSNTHLLHFSRLPQILPLKILKVKCKIIYQMLKIDRTLRITFLHLFYFATSTRWRRSIDSDDQFSKEHIRSFFHVEFVVFSFLLCSSINGSFFCLLFLSRFIFRQSIRFSCSYSTYSRIFAIHKWLRYSTKKKTAHMYESMYMQL